LSPWRLEIPDCPAPARERLQAELGVSATLAQILVRRGLGDPAVARAYLQREERHPASAFRGIGDAVALIGEHLASRRRITIHGDYDVDGVCSTAILVRALRALGADVDWYLPDRASDGYGLNLATVRRLAERGTRLLITADCAIGAVEEVAAARALGLDVVVTDHHSPRADGTLPSAPIVHPALCGYPCPELCATAVAYKLAEALFESAGRPLRELAEDLDLVALATIADVVPLLGENRTLAAAGLRRLAGTAKPGLRALMAVSGVAAGAVNERAVAFALAPRLNAAGRLYRADAALELLLTDDSARAGEVARELDSANSERREVERRIRFEAEAQMAQLGEQAAYVLSADGWHAGVTGIVASRLVERSGRPVVLIALDGERGKASGRSIEEFDLLAGLRACSAHLLRYGGHRAAAGLEIERARVPEFARALCEHARQTIAAEGVVEVERVDAVLEGGEITMALAEELLLLAPFGRGNPRPNLLIDGAVFEDLRAMGEGKHLRFTVRSHGVGARAVAFGCGASLPVREGEPAQATFSLEVNEWNGASEPRLVLRRVRAVEPEPGAPGLQSAEPVASIAADAGERERAGEQPRQLELALF
jgi:single-stranded-DNA-specific exonuclease